MAAQGGDTVHPLIEQLERDPTAHSFFRVVWMLERANAKATPVGTVGAAKEEAVRLRPSSSLAFPTSDVSRVERLETDERRYWRVTTPLLGLYGVTSPLPTYFTEDILESEMVVDDDPGRLLLDLVNHRVLALLYRAWIKYRWDLSYRPDGSDSISRGLMGLLGLATPEQRAQVALPHTRLLRYAAAFTQRRSASQIGAALSDWFEVPARVEQNIERRVGIVDADRCYLGRQNSSLGNDVVLGDHIRDLSGKCRVEIGPVPFTSYDDFHPGGDHYGTLAEFTGLLLPDMLAFDLRLRVEPHSVPRQRLGIDEGAGRLGWSSWLDTGADRSRIESDLLFPEPPTPWANGAN